MKKKLITFMLFMSMVMATEATAISPYRFYKKLVRKERIGIIREYNAEDLTGNILRSRNGDIIIEKMIGTVTNRKGDGRLMGVSSKYNYISYKGVKGIHKGDVILTICIYNPSNNFEDDIIERFDYIIDRKLKRKEK